MKTSPHSIACATVAVIAFVFGTNFVCGQQPPPAADADATVSSGEQGQTSLTDSFEPDREWRLQKRREALKDTTFNFNLRTYFLDRDNFDATDSAAFTAGGWAGVKTGYFLDHIAFGLTGYTSQRLAGDEDEDGTLLLAPGQESYSVLGELYADIRIIDGLNLYVGRKGFDTPFINRNDTRMTPNTFQAVVLQGETELCEGTSTLKYLAGYFDKIKERNSDEFVSMSEDAGATVDRGVFAAGAIYEKGNFSVGAIDYYSPDIINIAYAEARLALNICDRLKPKLAVQFTDQRSVGDESLTGTDFSAQQFGFKVELPVEKALFSAGYTLNTDGDNMQNPWSGYPGFTSVQVQEFDRAGEDAFLVRAGYEFSKDHGISAYALGVFGTDPDDAAQYRQDEYDVNLQWAPPEGVLKGLSLRLRYALVQQHGDDSDDLTDFRVICNYAINF